MNIYNDVKFKVYTLPMFEKKVFQTFGSVYT